MDDSVQQQTLRIYQDMAFLALDFSCRNHTLADQSRAPFFRALDALAINDRSRRAGVSFGQFSTLHVKRVVDAIQRPIVIPAMEVVVQGAARRKVFGDRGPLASCAQNVHKAVDNLPLVNRTLVAASLGRRDLRSDPGPLLVRHITRIPQLATVIPAAVLVRPHWQSLRIGTAVRESQATQ